MFDPQDQTLGYYIYGARPVTLGYETGFIGAKAAHMLGRRFDEKAQNDYIRQCRAGTLDVAVVSAKSRKNGCNLQGMNWDGVTRIHWSI